jgi:hypothetical protein
VILSFRDLALGARHEIPIDLVATVPRVSEAPTSSAYLSYTDDLKTWVEPLRVEVLLEATAAPQ